MANTNPERRQRKVGTVLKGNNTPKTVVVGVEWSRRHPVYRKQMRKLTKFVAHDEKGEAKRGDTVLIEETRPISATKRWRLVEVVTRGNLAEVSPEVAAAVPDEVIGKAVATATAEEPQR
jgi:small subunit ribosomal protein S17